MTRFQELQRVRVKAILSPKTNDLNTPSVPKVGDIGFIVSVFTDPYEAYCVEYSTEEYDSKWLADFLPEELEIYEETRP